MALPPLGRAWAPPPTEARPSPALAPQAPRPRLGHPALGPPAAPPRLQPALRQLWAPRLLWALRRLQAPRRGQQRAPRPWLLARHPAPPMRAMDQSPCPGA